MDFKKSFEKINIFKCSNDKKNIEVTDDAEKIEKDIELDIKEFSEDEIKDLRKEHLKNHKEFIKVLMERNKVMKRIEVHGDRAEQFEKQSEIIDTEYVRENKDILDKALEDIMILDKEFEEVQKKYHITKKIIRKLKKSQKI